MSLDARVLRCAGAAAVVLGLLAMDSCSTAASDGALTPTSPLVTSPTQSAPSPAAPVDVSAAFGQGLADFCTKTALAQRQASLSRPVITPADVQAFSRTLQRAWTARTDQLETVTPPPALAGTFAQFVDNARAMAAARGRLARDPDNSAVGAGVEDLFLVRRPLAAALGARRCDGELPMSQQRAVVDATRTFMSSIDPAQGCGALVTATFVETQFTKTADPEQFCTDEVLRLADNPQLRSHSITATEITGTEGISATVTFTEDDGCCAGIPTVARLYYLDGRWKIHSANYS